MDFSWQYVTAAAVGGLIGGLGHALLSTSPGFGSTKPDGTKDFSGYRDLAVGFFSGLVWLLPNQKTWVDLTPKSGADFVLIGLQTLVIGLAGSGWLTSHLDADGLKSDAKTLQNAAAKAAGAAPNPDVAAQISSATSADQVAKLVSSL
jgi:hypothetical protein